MFDYLRKKIKKLLYLSGIIGGGGIFLYQLIKSYQALRLYNEKFLVSPKNIFAGFLFGGLFYYLQMVNWSLILHALGVHIPFTDIFRNYRLSFLARYIPGTVWGYMSRSEWLHQAHGIPYKRCLIASIIEVTIPVISASLILILYLTKIGSNWALKTLLTIGALLFPFFSWSLFEFLRSKITWPVDLSGHDFSISLPDWLKSVLLFSTNWGSLGLMLLLFVSAVNVSPQFNLQIFFVEWWKATFVYTAAWLVGFMIIFVPAGIGVRELVLQKLLVNLFEVTSEQALAISVVSRLVILSAEGLWLIIGIFIKNRSLPPSLPRE